MEAVAEGHVPGRAAARRRASATRAAAPRDRAMFSGGRWRDARARVRARRLAAGQSIEGPRSSPRATPPPWSSRAGEPRVTDLDHLVLERVAPAPGAPRRRWARTVDPVMLEVFNNLFMNIAEQMGVQLQNTAYSVNIKERLDFSCALFDADGDLVANAPHMPVHLGSMSESIKTVIARERRAHAARRRVRAERPVPRRHAPARRDGRDARVRPTDGAGRSLFYVASRGHHADIGGVTPGLDAAVLDAHRGGGRADRQRDARRAVAASARPRCSRCSTGGPHPARNPQQNLADLRAQIAANETGGTRAAQDDRRSSGSRSCRRTCATCRTTARSRCGG